MNNNPLASVIRDAYIKDVLSKPEAADNNDCTQNTIENILRNKRICRFENAINRFLTNCGQEPVKTNSMAADEKNLLMFALLISGYIRDAQDALSNLSLSQACDPDLIDLYRAASKYSVESSGKIKDSKYRFTEQYDYKFWKVINDSNLTNAQFMADGFSVDPKRHNLFVAMPFHINPTQEELQKWSNMYLNQALDNKEVFNSQVDVYMSHFPIETPRCDKFALSLKTMRAPSSYYEVIDMDFVKKNWANFLGQDLKFDENNKCIAGTPYDAETFKANCKNITILGYCSAVAHSHRMINAFERLSRQFYSAETTAEALKNIFVVSYAFLPAQKESKYSGVHFMSNFADDNLRKEPFVKMFNPELYEQVKYRQGDGSQARVTQMPDGRNYVIALNLPEDFGIWKNGEKHPFPYLENGHHMGIVTEKNENQAMNYTTERFINVLENASLGRRGREVFNVRENMYQNRGLFFMQAYLAQKSLGKR